MGDICDGEVFKENDVIKDDHTAIQIIAYYDLVEVVNPLGTRTNKHKLGKHLYGIYGYTGLRTQTYSGKGMHIFRDIRTRFFHAYSL